MKIHKHGKHIKTINTVIESCLLIILIVLVAIMMVLIGKLQELPELLTIPVLSEVLLKEKSSLKSLVILMMSSLIILMEFLKILNMKMAIIILSSLMTMIMKKLDTQIAFWILLKNEIYKVREYGYENTYIVNLSEEYFQLADQTVSAAEKYSERIACNIRLFETFTAIDMVIIIIYIINHSIHAIIITKRINSLKSRHFLTCTQVFLTRVNVKKYSEPRNLLLILLHVLCLTSIILRRLMIHLVIPLVTS